MIRAVGYDHWPTTFAIGAGGCPGGAIAGLQTITMPHGRMLASSTRFGWIQSTFSWRLIPLLVEAIEPETLPRPVPQVTPRGRCARTAFAPAPVAGALRRRARAPRSRLDPTSCASGSSHSPTYSAGFRSEYLDVRANCALSVGRPSLRPPWHHPANRRPVFPPATCAPGTPVCRSALCGPAERLSPLTMRPSRGARRCGGPVGLGHFQAGGREVAAAAPMAPLRRANQGARVTPSAGAADGCRPRPLLPIDACTRGRSCSGTRALSPGMREIAFAAAPMPEVLDGWLFPCSPLSVMPGRPATIGRHRSTRPPTS